MSASHYFEGCRSLYADARKEGSPVVNVFRLYGDQYCAETADGKVLVEDINGCCKWAIKYEIAREWLDNHQSIK